MRITLCGSTRFKKEYEETNILLTKAGHTVYTVSCMMHADSVPLTEIEKENLDLVHLDKIRNSDAILVVSDGSNYVGASTRREIVWAQMHNKMVYWSARQLIAYTRDCTVIEDPNA